MTKIVELVLNEEEEGGIYAISIVDFPAIESNFIALSKDGQTKYSLAQVDEEKKMLVGAALIPNKQIYRKDAEENDYYVYFSKDTVKKAAYRFLKSNAHHNHTLQHEKEIDGLYVAESWIVESENDKSKDYGLNVPIGTWMVAVKVDNDRIWEDQIKSGNAKGFSIEAYFTNKLEASKVEMESYTDYPQGATNNAKRVLKWAEKNGWGSCGTGVGKARANQLANREPISRDTIARMASFKRHQQYKDIPYSEGCGGLMWDAWGGSSGVNWAISKLKEIDSLTKIVAESESFLNEIIYEKRK